MKSEAPTLSKLDKNRLYKETSIDSRKDKIDFPATILQKIINFFHIKLIYACIKLIDNV